MRIDTYQIDLLDVKAADACLIRFRDSDTQKDYTVLIDSGNYTDGKVVVDFIMKYYKTNTIDLAICTHCDKDHFGGFIWILEEMKKSANQSVCIKEMWIIDPANHIVQEDVKNRINNTTLYKRARSVYDLNDQNLLDILDEMKDIIVHEPFSDGVNNAFDGIIDVIGPSKDYYKEKALDFRNDLEKAIIYSDDGASDIDDATIDESKIIYSKALDDACDDSSSHNQTSVMILFKPNESAKHLFMGDAGRDAIDKLKYESDLDQIKDLYWLKVPHHGSKHNMDSHLINHMNPKIACISTKGVGHYLNMATVNALKKKGATVYSTHKSRALCLTEGTGYLTRINYTPANPL